MPQKRTTARLNGKSALGKLREAIGPDECDEFIRQSVSDIVDSLPWLVEEDKPATDTLPAKVNGHSAQGVPGLHIAQSGNGTSAAGNGQSVNGTARAPRVVATKRSAGAGDSLSR